jgi:FlaA1/EpsC-like NDP-sugar epimerase
LEDKSNTYKDSVVLITGGTGSIGLELSQCLLQLGVRKVRLFTNDENGLFEAQTVLGTNSGVEYRLGDVRDSKAVQTVVEGCDVVFHAAALKHVNFCEENPYEAISTNILGTQNLVDCTLRSKVQNFVLISTDKAVNPINTMGATKLLAEKLTLNASRMSDEKTICCVRFGNVLGTRGSVVRIFEKQIRDDHPVTMRDPEMTRFIMLPSDASKLVLQASKLANNGETFVLDMPAVKLGNLAEACIKYFAKLYRKDATTIRLTQSPPSPGEKFHEELMTSPECRRAIRKGKFLVVPGHSSNDGVSKGDFVFDSQGYTSNSVPHLTTSETIDLLDSLFARVSSSMTVGNDELFA